MFLQYSENKQDMQIKKTNIFDSKYNMLSLYRNKIRTINIVLITKSYDKSAWCNFSVHCLYY